MMPKAILKALMTLADDGPKKQIINQASEASFNSMERFMRGIRNIEETNFYTAGICCAKT